MSKLPVLKPIEVVRTLEKVGFYIVYQKGNYIQMQRGDLLEAVPTHALIKIKSLKVNFASSANDY